MVEEVKVTTDSLELRVLELEDTVHLLSRIAGNIHQMMKVFNEITRLHTEMLDTLLTSLGGARGVDTPPWEDRSS